MAISGKYGKIDIPKIGASEPVFILRAQDELAETAIKMYQLLATSHKCILSEDLQAQISVFHDWPGQKKMPD